MSGICFTYIWKIENFSYLSKLVKNEEILSPSFVADNLEKTQWLLRLHPPGYSALGYSAEQAFRFHLSKISRTGPNVISLDYEISVLSKHCSKEKSTVVRKFRFHEGNALGSPLCVTLDEIFSKREIMPDGTLTIQCKMWHNPNQYIGESAFTLARTRIDEERKFFTWTIEQFSTLQAGDQRSISVLLFSSHEICLTLTLFLSDSWSSYSSENIQIKIKGKSKVKSSFLVLGISVQDTNGKSAHHFQSELSLKKESEEFSFPFTLGKKQLLEDKDLLLPEDALSLKCDMVVYEVVLNRIELSGFGRNSISELEAILSDTNPPFCLGKRKRHPSLNSLTSDLRYLFEEKQHADVNLQVQNETFPAHKAILAARSSVFKTMFDIEMKEKFTNTIEIDDIEPDTMRRLLLYIYSENLDSKIQWENVSSLYLAAEKYNVLGLKDACSSYLIANINISNVGETLVLADMLNNDDLKSFAMKFIQDKNEVLDSEEWKHFAENHAQLTVDILTRLYRNVKRF